MSLQQAKEEEIAKQLEALGTDEEPKKEGGAAATAGAGAPGGPAKA